MMYLNSYSIDELGIKMRNLFFLIMLLSTSLYYVVQQESMNYNYVYILPLLFILFVLLIFFTRNSFGKKKEDFIQFNMSKVVFFITFTIFLISPLLHVIVVPLMPGDLKSQLTLSFVMNFLIGYFSFKILLPGDLSRIHATEYRNSAVAVKTLEKENTGKPTPSIKAELKLSVNDDSQENDSVEISESEKRIQDLLKEQQELMRISKMKK